MKQVLPHVIWEKIDTIFDHNEQVCLLKNGDKKIFHIDSLIGIDTSLIDTVFIQAVYKPTAFSHIVKAYNRNIQEQSVALKRDELAEFLIKDEDPFINIVKVPVDSTPSPLVRANDISFSEARRNGYTTG